MPPIGLPRFDVCGEGFFFDPFGGPYPGRPGCPNVGFSFQWNTAGLTNGTHTIVVQATDSDATPRTGASQPLTVIVGVGLPPTVVLDKTPRTVEGTVPMSGWALDNASAVETAISKVEVFVDGVKGGNATYGQARTDVCAAFPGRPGCPNVGFSFQWNTAGLTAGPHFIIVSATDSDGTPKSGSFTVINVAIGSLAPTVFH